MEFFSQENMNSSFELYNNYSLDQFDYVFDGLLSNNEDCFGGVWDDQFSYSSSLVATSLPDKVSMNNTNALLAKPPMDDCATSSTKPNTNVTRSAGRKARGDSNKTPRVAFKTKSKLDVLNDGYRWRKYGKKTIKNNPNLRNYYKCTSGGCKVKKIVERWIEDSSYVITQYDGVHNHE